MRISDVMTRNPRVLKGSESALVAAREMADHDIGIVLVEKDDKLIGVLTDRDILVRVLALGRNAADTRLEDIVSPRAKYCFEDDEAENVADNMDELLVRRLPVMNREKRLVGIVSIDDIHPRAGAH